MDADVTDSAGTPDGPEEHSEATTPSGTFRTPGTPRSRRQRLLRWSAVAASVAVLTVAGAGWVTYQRLDGNITTDTGTADLLKRYEAERPASTVHDAVNILIIGSDSRANSNREYGRDTGTQRSDTTILLHLAADRKSATAVSVPRDLMVSIPLCRTANGKRTGPRFGQFNSAFELGGPACTIRTVEKLTDIRIDHHMIVDFTGFKRMVDAVNGVEVCLKEPVHDADAHLDLPAGRQKLNGEEALGYVRARYGFGGGSDTERIGRQQQFLGSLVHKLKSDGVLLNPVRLYPVLDSATSSLTTDAGLDSLRELFELVRGVRNVPTDKVQFLTVPRRPYSLDPNRDELVQPTANRLFDLLRNDRKVSVVSGEREPGTAGTTSPDNAPGTAAAGRKSPPAGPSDEPAGPAPTYRGTTAATHMC